MKPTDLDDLTPLEPDDDVLDRVHERTATFRRRRGYQRALSVGSGVLVLALAAAIVVARADTTKSRVTTPVPVATTTTIAPTTAAVTLELLNGAWRPVSIAGFTSALGFGDGAPLRFDGFGGWIGSDGCNDTTGTYHLGTRGEIKLVAGAITQVGCDYARSPAHPDGGPIPKVPLPIAAAHVELLDGRLTFFARDGHQMAQYARTGLTAHVELKSTSIAAGAAMAGRVVVDNYSGHAAQATGCVSFFQVLLINSEVHASPSWYACAQNFAFPVGESSYPVTISASYGECSNDAASGGAPECPGGSPPLPPGVYQAKLFQTADIAPPPPTITMRVVPAVSSP